MSAATQIYDASFDRRFWKLPDDVQRNITAKIDDLSGRLRTFKHYQMTGSRSYRVRVGDYRVIYEFDLGKGEIYLLSVGHRREIYR